MAIPFGTTHLVIVRSTFPLDEDGYDPPADHLSPDSVVVQTGIRAVVTVPTANTVLTIGQRIVYTSKLTADPCDLRPGDLVTESSGLIWTCLWSKAFGAFGISGIEAQLQLVVGLAQ